MPVETRPRSGDHPRGQAASRDGLGQGDVTNPGPSCPTARVSVNRSHSTQCGSVFAESVPSSAKLRRKHRGNVGLPGDLGKPVLTPGRRLGRDRDVLSNGQCRSGCWTDRVDRPADHAGPPCSTVLRHAIRGRYNVSGRLRGSRRFSSSSLTPQFFDDCFWNTPMTWRTFNAGFSDPRTNAALNSRPQWNVAATKEIYIMNSLIDNNLASSFIETFMAIERPFSRRNRDTPSAAGSSTPSGRRGP